MVGTEEEINRGARRENFFSSLSESMCVHGGEVEKEGESVPSRLCFQHRAQHEA